MISTHILDTSLGIPGKGISVLLEKQTGKSWQLVSEEFSNEDGRIKFPCEKSAGTYRLTFHLEDYFKSNQLVPFFVMAPVIFKITNTDRQYHIPLLLNPYGYSTYRGS